jgi:hypothetical protein
MKIIMSDVVSSASGRSNGLVFSRNRYGAYARKHTVPVNPNTERQVAARARTTYLMDRWASTLTAAQRTAWELYASSVGVLDRFGKLIFPTGANHYLRSNSVRMQAGLDVVDDGPTTFALPGLLTVPTAVISAATNEMTLTYADTIPLFDEDGAAMLLYVGKPQSPTINFFNGPWKFADSVDGDSVTPPTSPATIACPEVCTEGQKVWAYVRIATADGRLSNPFRVECTVGA